MEEINEAGHRLVPLRKGSMPSTSYLNQSAKKNSIASRKAGSHFPDVSQSNQSSKDQLELVDKSSGQYK